MYVIQSRTLKNTMYYRKMRNYCIAAFVVVVSSAVIAVQARCCFFCLHVYIWFVSCGVAQPECVFSCWTMDVCILGVFYNASTTRHIIWKYCNNFCWFVWFQFLIEFELNVIIGGVFLTGGHYFHCGDGLWHFFFKVSVVKWMGFFLKNSTCSPRQIWISVWRLVIYLLSIF